MTEPSICCIGTYVDKQPSFNKKDNNLIQNERTICGFTVLSKPTAGCSLIFTVKIWDWYQSSHVTHSKKQIMIFPQMTNYSTNVISRKIIRAEHSSTVCGNIGCKCWFCSWQTYHHGRQTVGCLYLWDYKNAFDDCGRITGKKNSSFYSYAKVCLDKRYGSEWCGNVQNL